MLRGLFLQSLDTAVSTALAGVLRSKTPKHKIRMDADSIRRHGCRCFHSFRWSFAKQNSLSLKSARMMIALAAMDGGVRML